MDISDNGDYRDSSRIHHTQAWNKSKGCGNRLKGSEYTAPFNQISEKDASYYALSKALESKDDEISELKAAMERRQMQSPEVVGDIDRIKSDMQREMSELFRNSWNILNILCNQFLRKGNRRSCARQF